jgi:metal-responsive CopG/Arc/MetJ family transcriptional regulator
MDKVRKVACFPPAAVEPELLKQLEAYVKQHPDTNKSAVIRQAVRIFLSTNMPKSTLS